MPLFAELLCHSMCSSAVMMGPRGTDKLSRATALVLNDSVYVYLAMNGGNIPLVQGISIRCGRRYLRCRN